MVEDRSKGMKLHCSLPKEAYRESRLSPRSRRTFGDNKKKQQLKKKPLCSNCQKRRRDQMNEKPAGITLELAHMSSRGENPLTPAHNDDDSIAYNTDMRPADSIVVMVDPRAKTWPQLLHCFHQQKRPLQFQTSNQTQSLVTVPNAQRSITKKSRVKVIEYSISFFFSFFHFSFHR